MDEDFEERGFEEIYEDDTDFMDEDNLEELREEDEISLEEEGFMNGYREALKKTQKLIKEELE